MRVLLTGATGFVGPYVADALARQGFTVRALVRSRAKAASQKLEVHELAEGDLSSPQALAAACKRIDAVVHLAGLTKAARTQDFEAVNVVGSALLAKAARDAGVVRFVLMSSLAAAGPSLAGGTPRRESDSPSPVSAYGRSKLEGERACAAALAGSSVKLTILRPPIVYGEGERDLLIAFQQVQRGFLPVVGGSRSLTKRYSLIHAEDLARTTVAALETSPGGAFFTPGPGNATFLQMVEAMERALGCRARRIPIPVFLAMPVAWAIAATARIGGRPSIINPDKLREIAAPGWESDGAAATHTLAHAPKIDIDTGFSREVAWARALRLL